ncbi:MAG: ribose 5-phosphate isomerase B [Bacteroidota bacterium]|nr:ribose 5-phosphate isomerase B [Bacteroidota bacterium]
MFNKNKELLIASDHAGFPIKEFIRKALEDDGYTVKDLGTYSEDSVDYPDFIHPLARSVNKGLHQLGIIICGSGNGAQMVANKYPNIRAALCWNNEQAELSRLHNNANIISIPGRFIEKDLAIEMVTTFLNTEFEGGRHERRAKKISEGF